MNMASHLMFNSKKAITEGMGLRSGLTRLVVTDFTARELIPVNYMPVDAHAFRIGLDDIFILTAPSDRILEPAPTFTGGGVARYDILDEHDTPSDELNFVIAAYHTQDMDKCTT